MHRRARTPLSAVVGAAVALSLTLAAAPALAAPPAEPDPVPGLVAGTGTEAPQLVTGLAEAAPGGPAEAARAHLAAHRDRYKADPAQLAEVSVERAADGGRTVRFQQLHHGIPVFGARYQVHLTGEGERQQVESAGGKYFTGLTAPAAATVPDAALRGAALAAVEDLKARAGARAEDRGLVVLPGGVGRLARHFTVLGAGRDAEGAPLVREVFVDANLGVVALSYSSRGSSGGGLSTAAAGLEPSTGTAPDAFGRTVPVNTGRLPDGSHQLVDLTRPGTVTTYDAAGRDLSEFGSGGLPVGLAPVTSPGPAFPAAAGTGGATDAHRNAGAVYDFYRDRFGRDGLDGKGGPVVSVVNVTAGGQAYANAYWDGRKMVYGGGDEQLRPFAAALDVAGHEMTHGVISHTADLAYFGQSGAMNEAIADYLGNAVELTVRGIPMSDPRAGLLGEDLCRTGTPEQCVGERRLDTGRTTVDHYVGAGPMTDNGGVHLNSAIFAGALWDIRRTLDPATADRLVYRALTEYLTPLDDFVDGRNAVLAAGRAMKLGRAELRSVAKAFDEHGVRQGWQRRLGTDSRTLVAGVNTNAAAPAAAGGRWVMANTDEARTGQPTLHTGRTDGSGAVTRLSPEDGRWHHAAATDGRTAVWKAVTTTGPEAGSGELLARPLDGGPVRSVYRSAKRGVEAADAKVSGGDIAFVESDWDAGRHRVLLTRDGGPAVEIPLPAGHQAFGLSFQGGLLAWTEFWTEGDRAVLVPTVYSLAAGRVTARYRPADDGTTASGTVLAGGRVLWTEDSAAGAGRTVIRSGAPDGSGAVDVVAGAAPGKEGAILWFTASERAVTYTPQSPLRTGGWSNAVFPKLWQVPLAGGTPERVSCNRGSQENAVADRGTRVLWLDSTAGRTELVTRARPAGVC